MKILFVITGLGMGGAENLVVNLADKYAEEGHQVAIAYAFGDVVVSPNNKAVKLFSLGVKGYKDALQACIKVRRLIRNFKPDAVHSHMVHANLLARLVRITTTIPRLICTAHNTNEGGGGRMLAYRLTDSLNDISTNVSQEAVDTFISLGAVNKGRMLSIPNGIDIDRCVFSITERANYRKLLNASNKLVLIAVGRLNEQKDYPNLINAIAILAKERNDFCLKIVGDGELKEDMIQLARNLNVLNYIEFLGIRRDIPQLMSASDVFVLSSSYEGFGLVVAEAMSCERVVVATDCGGVREVVGDCGLLVEPGNPEALAQAIKIQLELSVDEKRSQGRKARRRIMDKFSLESTANKYMELYKGNYS
ncbi:glycosyltransferase [Aliivibrio finisterrensis]|uniref:Glycosyltransferase n=1 Tax=Aliivibrio finisterrensis TaxID=511998 RepID=A0ABY0I3L8_9GAMM|nr:glycosyltransferase [Aliivibrio finisterrensis]RYU61829.1 glycosyltransferase [Aliivibrio finisterrensis]RYU80705.1 glycosyltransferase [Aliivibrio finisterrensis]